MLRRLQSFFSRERSVPYEPLDPRMSPAAQRFLEKSLDRPTIQGIMNIFEPLPQLYRSPEQMLERIAQAGLLKMTYGYCLNPFIPYCNYILPFQFDPTERISGNCGDIARWFLYDLQQSQSDKVLQSNGIEPYISAGNSPEFFSDPGSTHVWVSLKDTKSRSEVIVDPSFGRINTPQDEPGYRIKSQDKLSDEAKKGLFNTGKPRRIFGWQETLQNGRICAQQGERESPYSYVLGLSKNTQHVYSLGIETTNDKPFISVSFPHGLDQELYWLDHTQNGASELGVMSSISFDKLAVHNTETLDEVNTMLSIIDTVHFDELRDDDIRIQNLRVNYT